MLQIAGGAWFLVARSGYMACRVMTAFVAYNNATCNILLLPDNFRTKISQTGIDVLVAAVDLLDIVDGAFAFG